MKPRIVYGSKYDKLKGRCDRLERQNAELKRLVTRLRRDKQFLREHADVVAADAMLSGRVEE